MLLKYLITGIGWILFIAHRQVQTATIDELIAGAVEDVGAMDYDQGDGTVMVEMDMKFKAEDWELIEYSMENHRRSVLSRVYRKKRKAIRFEDYRWTNNVVPYFLSNVFSSSELAQIRAAFAEWERYTCIDFRPYRTGDSNYIMLQNGDGCSSYVGSIGGSQPVNLAPGCRYKSIVVHELGHAIGFHHEQTRPDRDSYVRIYLQNIVNSQQHNFQKYSDETINDYNVPYDYLSVMHYGEKAFTSNGQRTIETIDPSKQSVIGSAQGLSFRDIKLANAMYKCSESCPSISCRGEGFVGKDCQCWCPGSPVRLCNEPTTTTTTTTRRPQTTTTTTTPGGFNPPNLTGFDKYPYEGCPGNLLEFDVVETVYHCALNCNERHNCVAFEFNNEFNGCYMKRVCNAGSLQPKTNQEVAYIKINTGGGGNGGEDVDGYTKYYQKGCPGNLLALFHPDLTIKCAALCNVRSNCVAFEYNTENYGCYLKTACDANNLVPKTRTETAYIKNGGGSSGGGNNVCTDSNTHCPYWSRTGECHKNQEYMLTYCRKSCQVC